MTRLHVILAADGLDGVRDVLQDLSAQGLVSPFVWVSSAGAPVTIIEAGRPRRDHLQAAVAASRADGAVFTVLAGALEGVAPVDEATSGAVEHAVIGSLGHGIPLVRVRATIMRAASDAVLQRIANPGWHNAVLAPEDAAEPSSGREVLGPRTPAVDVRVHAAVGLAGLVGLWTGVEDTAFGTEPPSPAASAQLSRSFIRHLEASPAELAVRERVLTTDHALPLPSVQGRAVYVEDVARATKTASTQYWQRSSHHLRSPREQVSETKVAPIGPLAALGMLFSFIGAALRNAPGQWLDKTVRSMKAGAAARVHEIVFGTTDAAYGVVVGGIRADGATAGWDDYGHAVEKMSATLSQSEGGAHPGHADLSPLWRDYAHAAFTLCDAGPRVPEVPPIEVGATKGIIGDRNAVIPGPETAFSAIPHVLSGRVSVSPLLPYDVLEVAETERVLTQLASEPGVGVTASATLEDFSRWRDRHRSSFAVLVGDPIGRALTATRQEVVDILRRLAEGASEEVPEEDRVRQRRIAWRLRLIAAVALVLVIVVAILPAIGAIALTVALWIILAIVMSWFLASFWTFYSGQRETFRLFNQRRQLQSQQEVDRANLKHALSDASKLYDAYTQFQRWSEILGALLARPFADPALADLAAAPDLVGLPRSIGLGAVEPEDDARDLVVENLRRGVFEPGWLSDVWDSFLENAYQRLGARGLDFRSEPQLLLRQLGEGEHTVLPALRDNLLATGVDHAFGDALWASALALLAKNEEYRSATESLLRRVHSRTGTGAIVSYADFMGDLDPDAAMPVGLQRFDGSILTPSAQVSGAAAVVDTHRRSVRIGLGRMELLTQLSGGVPEYEFAALAVHWPAGAAFGENDPANLLTPGDVPPSADPPPVIL